MMAGSMLGKHIIMTAENIIEKVNAVRVIDDDMLLILSTAFCRYVLLHCLSE